MDSELNLLSRTLMKEKKKKLVKKKTRKTTKPTTRKSKKQIPVFEDYFDFLSWKQTPISIDGIEKKAEMLVEWATNFDDALIMVQWYNAQGLSGETIKRWKERCPNFGHACNLAKRIIGARRELGGLKKKFDSAMVRSTMPHYSKIWHDLAEWEQSIKKPVEEKSETKVVVIERYPTIEKI